MPRNSKSIYYASLEKELYRTRLLIQQTPQELKLWAQLRNARLGISFTRQKIILGYIVDFYSMKYRLAIEIDGPSVHDVQADKHRDSNLAQVGVHVIRFTNSEIDNNLPWVLKKIGAEIEVSKKLYAKRQAKRSTYTKAKVSKRDGFRDYTSS